MGRRVLRLDGGEHAHDRLHREGASRPPGGQIDVDRATTILLIGAVIWAYLGIIFEFLTETVAWERWEGTIEYTFMAPLSRAMHLLGWASSRSLYGLVRAILLFVVVALFFDLSCRTRTSSRRSSCSLVASISFIGIGMMTAVLPLISPEKGMQLGFVAQGILLVVSGVYYPVDVLPEWMQWLSKISPATYALEGMRDAILDGAGLADDVGRDLAAAHHRRGLDPARPLGLPSAASLREAARQAQALRMRAPSRSGEAGASTPRVVAVWNAITPRRPPSRSSRSARLRGRERRA